MDEEIRFRKLYEDIKKGKVKVEELSNEDLNRFCKESQKEIAYKYKKIENLKEENAKLRKDNEVLDILKRALLISASEVYDEDFVNREILNIDEEE